MISEWVLMGVVCLVSASMVLLWLTPRQAKPPLSQVTSLDKLSNDPIFLFEGTELVGLSDAGEREGVEIADWPGLRAHLAGRFPNFPESPDQIQQAGELVVPPVDVSARQDVHCEWIDGVTRVHLRQMDEPAPKRLELDPVRAATESAPYPVWCVDSQGAVCWHNEAYSRLARKVRGQDTRDLSPLFDLTDTTGPNGHRRRISISPEGSDQKLWFDLSVVERDENKLCYATDINAVVDAEVAQRNFVQTLAKTFAQLSIGLAIFDRNRQLALFNPALIDLTALPADFLSGRPSVMSFFDRLRNQNMMPEPKSYGGWRQQMNDLVEAAADGRYQETWSLPSGSVYSVSGRPHPDGAVAFLFEDITAEITLTRRFRSELELGQSILDQLEDAIAVFASDGALAFSNVAYHQLWQVDPEASFATVSVLDATRIWQNECSATPVWGEIRDFVARRENRSQWREQVHLRSGQTLICTISPIQNGGTMIRFTSQSHVSQTPKLSAAQS
ncbi:Sensor protein DivL [Falsiruegeria litorea R37]|uniref:Sensor protein DivL n=1 Tax=Falsiruegeria litorea R37 TaxID=1200284 RepID=A0A1Y5TPP9_9RHOB|nr:PAS-domain containing protein [Falsiruegeria litorea]SLN69210.1 Sensor protein DivL [Falsiruegeria litorea R37]